MKRFLKIVGFSLISAWAVFAVVFLVSDYLMPKLEKVSEEDDDDDFDDFGPIEDLD